MNESEGSSLIETRLRKVQQDVRKLTQEALQQSTGTGADLENEGSNASFKLGMELFGKEASAIERDVQEKLKRMEAELSILMDAVQKGVGISNNESDATGYSIPEQVEKESLQLQIKIRFLNQCSIARALLDDSITFSTQMLAPNEDPDLVQSARLVLQAKVALDKAEHILEEEREKMSLTSHTIDAARKIFDSVRASYRRQKVDLIATAASLWHKSVSMTLNTLSVSATKGLQLAYDVFEVFGNDTTLEMTLRKFTRTLFNDVFQPLLQAHMCGKPKQARVFYETEDKGTTANFGSHQAALNKGPVRRLEWNSEADNLLGMNDSIILEEPNVTAWKDTLAFFRRILVFVSENVLLERTSICDFVALRLFGKPNNMPTTLNLESLCIERRRLGDDNGLLLQPLVECMESTCIPRFLPPLETKRLHTMQQELSSYLDPFLNEMDSNRLLTLDGRSRMSSLTSAFEQLYVDNRRCILLNEARDMLVNNDYHNTIFVGEDIAQSLSKEDQGLGIEDGFAIFKLQKSSISGTASLLMKMCRSIMDEAVSHQWAPANSPLALLPAMLYKTAREVLDMFRAIIPITYGNEVVNIPRTAALLHNDCVYLAHHCLTLGLEYKNKFSTPTLDDTKGKLLRQTCMFIDMVPLFRDMADRSLGDMLDRQAQQLVQLVGDRITLMGEALRSEEILTEWSDAETALEAGTYHLRHLSQAWKLILSNDILNRSLCFLVDVMFSLILDQIGKAKDISSSACQFVHTLLLKATRDVSVLLDEKTSNCRVWDRFAAIGKLMDMSIADIQVALSDGLFRTVTGVELSRLVQSCFDDSPKRRQLLKLLDLNQ
jgi:Centromere/kinetochore Zw10